MFSKAAPAADATKLKPGIALPHVTLPTTEVRCGEGEGMSLAAAWVIIPRSHSLLSQSTNR